MLNHVVAYFIHVAARFPLLPFHLWFTRDNLRLISRPRRRDLGRRWRRWNSNRREPYIFHDVLLMATSLQLEDCVSPPTKIRPFFLFYNFLPHEKVQLHFKLRSTTRLRADMRCFLRRYVVASKNLDLLLAKTHKQSTLVLYFWPNHNRHKTVLFSFFSCVFVAHQSLKSRG